MKFCLLYLLFVVIYTVGAQDEGEQGEDSASGSGEGEGSGELSGSGEEETVTTTTLKSITTQSAATTATKKTTTKKKKKTTTEKPVSQESEPSTKSPDWSVELPQSNTETPQQVLEWVNTFLMSWLKKTQTPRPGPGLTSSTTFGVQQENNQNPFLKPPRVPGYKPESDQRGPSLRPTNTNLITNLNIPRVPLVPRRQIRPRSGGFSNYRTYRMRGFQF